LPGHAVQTPLVNVSTPATLTWRGRAGLRLHATDYRGRGDEHRRPVVCIPGLTRNARDFEDVAPWLAAQGRRVIAIDLRGRGRSEYDANAGNYRPDVYAHDVQALLHAAGIKRAHMLGTSLGGIVAMMLALQKLDCVAGAVLNDIGPEAGAAGLARIAGYVGKVAPVTSWDAAAAYVQQINGASFPHFGPDDWARFARRTFRDSPTGKPEFDYDPRISRPAPSARALRLASMLLWRGFRRLATQRPTLVLRGALSDLLEPATVARMKRAAPTLLVSEVPGVGHAPSLDEPVAREALAAYFCLVD